MRFFTKSVFAIIPGLVLALLGLWVGLCEHSKAHRANAQFESMRLELEGVYRTVGLGIDNAYTCYEKNSSVVFMCESGEIYTVKR